MNLRIFGSSLVLLAILLPGFVAAAFPTTVDGQIIDTGPGDWVKPYDQACANHISEKSMMWSYTWGCPYDYLMKLRNAFMLLMSLKGGTSPLFF
jgi:hypothetical protein